MAERDGGWRSVAISDIASPTIGGTPSRSVQDYWQGSIPWATAKDVAGSKSRYLGEVQESITELGLDHSSAKVMPKGTVVITARGTVGALAQLDRDMAFNQTCYALISTDKIENDFLYYALKGSLATMGTLTYGTVFQTITRKSFNEWLIPLPPLPEQRAISHVLGTLDDKIELNRRMNETLEGMARALFKSWFVDFEPVRAKMDGRWRRGESLPGLPSEWYDLFPDGLVDSELGAIPAGWEVKGLGEVVELNPREPMKRGTLAPYLNMAALSTSVANPDEPILREYTSGTRFRNKDTLLARITPCLENGKAAYIQSLSDGLVGWGSTEFIVMRPKPPVPSEYAYLLARDDAFRAHAIQSMTGTSGRQRARVDVLAPYPIAYPPADIWRSFRLTAKPMFARLRVSALESRALSGLRDALLPKLVSGDVSSNVLA